MRFLSNGIGMRRIMAGCAVVGLATIGVAAAPQPAHAWWRGGYGWCCSVGIALPPVVVAPAPVYAPPPAYAYPSAPYLLWSTFLLSCPAASLDTGTLGGWVLGARALALNHVPSPHPVSAWTLAMEVLMAVPEDFTPIADFAVDTSPAPSREIGQHRFNQITPFLVAALAGQVIVPLGAIWLSDAFAFDIPAWWKWLIFGGTLPLSLVPVLIYRAVRAR